MRTRIHIAWRSLCHNRRQAASVFFLSACAAALLLASSFLGSGIRSGLVSAVTPFDLLVGNGGSYQMVVNTVFLQDYPTGNVPYDLVETLRADERVAAAVPLGFGDNYLGYRIVGTEAGLFRLPDGSGGDAPWLRLNRGKLFSDPGREAVAGARAARELGLEVGDEIVTAHGFIENEGAESHEPLIVSGILEPCEGPYDRAVFVPLSTIWEEHGGEDWGDEEHGHKRQATAIMVKPAGYAEAYALFTEFQNRDDAEMVFPAQAVVRLLSILGQSEWVFKTVGGAAGVLATAIVFLVLYWSACSRTDEMRVLGLLGAEKSDRVLMTVLEGLFAVVPGVAAGFLAGSALLTMLGNAVAERSGLVTATGITLLDLGLIAMLVAVALFGGVAGCWRNMREE